MNQIWIVIGNLVIFGLAIWKVWDLCFGKRQNGKPSLVENWRQQLLLIRFFAEFTYKTMKGNGNYTEAPKEIYDWLLREFMEWGRQQNKK